MKGTGGGGVGERRRWGGRDKDSVALSETRKLRQKPIKDCQPEQIRLPTPTRLREQLPTCKGVALHVKQEGAIRDGVLALALDVF